MNGTPGTPPEKKALTWQGLLAITVKSRHDPAWAARTANLRLGAHPATEPAARALTDRYLTGLSDTQRPGARRAVALCAKHPNVHQVAKGTRMPFGASLAALHAAEFGYAPGAHPDGPARPNTITGSVDPLPMLDLDPAVAIIDILLERAARTRTPVNFFDLAATLIGWGNGISADSHTARTRILTDFYARH